MAKSPAVVGAIADTPTIDFKSLLSAPAEEAIIKPPPIPFGTWRVVIRNWELSKSRKKKTDLVRINWALKEPGPDIIPEDLNGVKWQGKIIPDDYYITPDAVYRLPLLFETIGMDISNKTVNDLLQDCRGTEAMMSVEHEASDDPTNDNVYLRIGGLAPVE